MKQIDRTSTPRPAPLWLRFLALGVGVYTLFWLPVEDTNEIAAIVTAFLIVGVFTLNTILRSQPTKNTTWYTLIGGLAGLAIIPVALLLIAFKTGLHDHGIPEISTERILSAIRKTPIFILGGSCIGLGIGFWKSSQNPKN